MRLSLLRRSRMRSSASVAIAEHSEELRDERLELRPRDDRVEVSEPVIRLGEAEVVGKLLACRLLDDSRTGEGHQRAGLGDGDVAEAGEAREDSCGRRVAHDCEDG